MSDQLNNQDGLNNQLLIQHEIPVSWHGDYNCLYAVTTMALNTLGKPYSPIRTQDVVALGNRPDLTQVNPILQKLSGMNGSNPNIFFRPDMFPMNEQKIIAYLQKNLQAGNLMTLDVDARKWHKQILHDGEGQNVLHIILVNGYGYKDGNLQLVLQDPLSRSRVESFTNVFNTLASLGVWKLKSTAIGLFTTNK